jgi:hypothetical protein
VTYRALEILSGCYELIQVSIIPIHGTLRVLTQPVPIMAAGATQRPTAAIILVKPMPILRAAITPIRKPVTGMVFTRFPDQQGCCIQGLEEFALGEILER